jgi:hypothetical protein
LYPLLAKFGKPFYETGLKSFQVIENNGWLERGSGEAVLVFSGVLIVMHILVQFRGDH